MAQSVDAIPHGGVQIPIDYTPGTDVAACDLVDFQDGGSIVMVGAARAAIEANKLGSLDVNGIYKVKKASGTTFARGVKVGWDVSANEALASGDANSDGDIGRAIAAAASGDDYVLCWLNKA